MATLSQPRITKQDSEIAPWAVSVLKGELDTQRLRKLWPVFMKTFGGMPFGWIEDQTGEVIILCDYCSKPSFGQKTLPSYGGAYNICEDCQKYYSWCDKCHSHVLTVDLGNPTHIHDDLLAIGNKLFKELMPVEAWNADIMQVGKLDFFRKSKLEQEIWKHRKEAQTEVLSKPHTDGTFRYFGVELELEKISGAPPNMVERTYNAFGNYAILKHDGSISNKGKNGFEIVTVPATMAYHKNGIWDSFFSNLAIFFQEKPVTTGLHVHIGLDTLGEVAVGKMLIFINSLKNKEFIESIAGRELNVPNPNGKVYAAVNELWKISDLAKMKQHQVSCPWHPKNRLNANKYLIDKESGYVKKDSYGNPIIASVRASAVFRRPACRCAPGMYNTQKYEAFNAMTKRPTVEIRIFRGIVNKLFLYSALEFCDALCDFTHDTPVSQVGYRDFLNWLTRYNPSGRSKLYPNLSRHLINKGWLDPSKEAPKPGVEKRTES